MNGGSKVSTSDVMNRLLRADVQTARTDEAVRRAGEQNVQAGEDFAVTQAISQAVASSSAAYPPVVKELLRGRLTEAERRGLASGDAQAQEMLRVRLRGLQKETPVLFKSGADVVNAAIRGAAARGKFETAG